MKKETAKKLSLITAAAMAAAMLSGCSSNDGLSLKATEKHCQKE